MRKLTKLVWFCALALITLGVGTVLWNQKDYKLVYASDEPVIVEIAQSKAERKRGLSYRDSLDSGHGMLFLLEGSGTNCMWMKDMNFNLDVYWFTESGDLISHKQNLSPDSYPSIYCPAVSAHYMLEVNSGELQAAPTKLTIF